MARLIPAFVDDQTPPGEYDVFSRLKNAPKEWTVIHSLDLAPWNGQRRTEIDFLAIVPDAGILCIEVKSHQQIYFDGERWHPATIKRSPFKQAADARYAFVRRIEKVAPGLSYIPVVHCCIFPRAYNELPDSLSVRSYELMDRAAFLATEDAFCSDLRRRMLEAIGDDPNLRPLTEPIPAATVDRIAELCVPVSRRRPDAREEVVRAREDLECTLRGQQKPVLNLARTNARLVVSGGAGTGKTLIAMEVARRAASQGSRVALLCFNRLVGNWMAQAVAGGGPVPPNLVVDRVTRLLAKLSGVAVPPEPGAAYWDGAFLDAVEDRLTDPDFRASAEFDLLVVDEAQDILARPRLWSCLTQFLSGSVTDGRYVLFGDFEHQVLGAKDTVDRVLDGVLRAGACARYTLSENCRNVRIVGEAAVCMSGFERDMYTGYLRGTGSTNDVSLDAYDSPAEQEALLAKHLAALRKAGYRDGEITVLSFCSPTSSAAERLRAGGHRLVALGSSDERTGRIGYTSVHAFKGMENCAIVLTDVIVGSADFHRQLFYTAMTRSTGPVRILGHSGSAQTLMKWMTEGLHA
jgi:hypothetical protein